MMEFDVDLKTRAERLIEGQDWGPSDFQMEHFIIGKAGLDDYSRYIQCLREIRSRVGRDPAAQADAVAAPEAVADSPMPTDAPSRELDRFVQLAEDLHGRLIKQYGSPLPLAWMDEDMWIRRITQKGLTELLLDGRLSPNSVDTLLALTPGLRNAVCRRLGRAAGLPNLEEKLSFIVGQTTSLGTLVESGQIAFEAGSSANQTAFEAMESEPSGTA